MSGPLAVIYNVVQNPGANVVTANSKVQPEIWIILIGALGLVIGLATYGYKVCGAVGTQMARITPSRGFAAELATGFIIMIAAQLGLPTSSSQCITGIYVCYYVCMHVRTHDGCLAWPTSYVQRIVTMYACMALAVHVSVCICSSIYVFMIACHYGS